jgi:hypothetical protein
MVKVVSKVLVVVGFVLATILAAVLGSVLFFVATRAADFAAQDRRLEAIAASAAPRVADDLSYFSIPPDTLMNEIQLVATHNSYRIRSDALRLFLLDLGSPGEAAKLLYGHEPLYEQLDSGIRSFELDVRYRRGRFETAHVPLVDDRSTCPDLGKAFREIQLWSTANPRHLPIVIILELKSDWLILDPALVAFDSAALEALDELVRSSFTGRTLFAPDDLRGRYATIAEAIASRGWPRLEEMLGRMVLVIHENSEYRRLYTNENPSLAGKAMFTCAPPGEPDSAFAILNDPFDPLIPDYRSRGIIVRTRADADLVVEPARIAQARASGAHIISTDFPPGEPRESDGFSMNLPGGRTARKLP